MKFNMENGGPAPTEFTNKIFEHSKKIKEYLIVPDLKVDINSCGAHEFDIDGNPFKVEVIDSLKDYVELMKDIFNFDQIKEYIKGTNILINSLHGVTGPYVEKIFEDELGVDPSTSFMKTTILPDFGGEHPDPNLTYAKDLVEAMQGGDFDFGAAFDGDGDRNMILGTKGFFVTPCDSVAVIANNLECIPYFQKTKITGYARSMPTSGALDRVAKTKGKECFETPTGWKFFGNLLDAERICLCGEESFGTGSSHVREKDGIWAALAWLQILASQKQSVKGVLENHWAQYGRNFFTRYDFEDCKSEEGQQMMDLLHKVIEDSSNIGKSFNSLDKTFTVSKLDDFSYTDPIDGSISTNQGIRVFFEDGSRIVYRLSGTGSSGATIRVYVDAYEADKEKQVLSAKEMLAPCVQLALKIADIERITGRKEPTVIT
uniref:phosphoglucomutase (alpha-D-glucose-1,6-bisphosphate-dependent) n=1 Tax=Lepeophtheirus salmonis TaxID=72036 RepID=A0A0K2TMK2_LEPSM